jgi:hypothetical protein
MVRTVILLTLLFQAGPGVRPTIVANLSEPPRRNFLIIYYDDSFLFAARHYGDSRDVGGNTEPGLFVHWKEHDRWVQILQISTAGGRFGKSWSDDPEARKKMRFASVSWDFTSYAERPYIKQPLVTSGSIAFPERVEYDSSTDRYELRYFSSWNVPSAETVLYVNRKDIVNAFDKQP